MKIKLQVFTLIFNILCFGQVFNSNDRQDIEEVISDSLFTYYPLQNGNLWVYKNIRDNSYHTEKVLSDTIINNRSYIKVQEIDDIWGYTEINFYRKDTIEKIIYKKEWQNDFEWKVDSLLCPDNCNWGYNSLDSVSIMHLFNQNRLTRHLHQQFYPPYHPRIGYAYGLGKIYARTQFPVYPHFDSLITDGYDLVYAIINGDEFGVNPMTNINNNSSQPVQYALYQNYPNPFNPVTTISYAIPENQIVQVIVFDLLGNKVAVLVNEYMHAGFYSIQFNANNLSSGIYFYELTTEKFVQAKKLILIK